MPNAILYFYWSGKGTLISGFIIATLFFLEERHEYLTTKAEQEDAYADMTYYKTEPIY
jgi:hypothetical protein